MERNKSNSFQTVFFLDYLLEYQLTLDHLTGRSHGQRLPGAGEVPEVQEGGSQGGRVPGARDLLQLSARRPQGKTEPGSDGGVYQ